MRRLVFALLLATSTACGLIAGLEDHSRLPPDAATTADTFAPDVLIDSAEPTIDGSTDFCSTVDATFCDDFDRGLGFTPWLSVSGINGDLVIEDGGAYSPPAALTLRLESLDSGVVRNRRLEKQFDAATGFDCSFRLRLDRAPPKPPEGGIIMFRMFWARFDPVDDSGVYPSLAIEADQDRMQLLPTSQSPLGANDIAKLGVNEWHSVRVLGRLAVDGGAGGSVMYFDGSERARYDSFTAAKGAGRLDLLLGASYDHDATEAWTIRYDDFACTIEP